MEKPRLPLAGIRVTDFTTVAAGPIVTKLLADYGAEVILIESETQLAASGGNRQDGPAGTSPVNTSYFHNKYNSNKLSLTLDLSSESGRRIMKQVLSISDLFVANRVPQVLKRFELNYEAISSIRPDIIYVNMPMMGSSGPRSSYSGPGWAVGAMAGINAISGYPDLPPSSPSPWAHSDVSSNPLHTLVAILAALRHRRKTGRGQMIELSQYESTVSWTGPAVLHYTVNGKNLARNANRHPGACPHDVYRTKGEDAWCAVCVFNDEQWQALCMTIGRPDLVNSPDFATLLDRKQHEEALREVFEAWTLQRTPEECMTALQDAGVPCSVLNNFEGLLHQDPQLRARRMWSEVQHPELGTTLFENWGFRLSRSQPRVARAPLLSEQNDYVLQDVLGSSEETVNHYIVEGVLH